MRSGRRRTRRRCNAYENDADSSFVMAYDMAPPVDLPEIGRQTVASGAQASVPLPDLAPGTTFDWYATVERRHEHDPRPDAGR